MQHRDYVTLQKIIEETKIATNLIGETTIESFLNNELLKRAIGMTLINIGELVKNLTADFRISHNNVPWKDISGFRDVAAHKYKTLDMKLVYNSVKIDVPELQSEIINILSTETLS